MPPVCANKHFDAALDGDALQAAIRKCDPDIKTIIDILCKRSNDQRQLIAKYFTEKLDRNLINELESKLCDNFKNVIVGLMLPNDQFLCQELQNALNKKIGGNKEATLIEILCTKNALEMKNLATKFEALNNCPLAEAVSLQTSGDFRRLLRQIITENRDKNGSKENNNEAMNQATALYKAGEDKIGTDEEVFIRIFTQNSFAQLRLVFKAYKVVAGNTIEQAIKKEFSGDIKKALLAIGKN